MEKPPTPKQLDKLEKQLEKCQFNTEASNLRQLRAKVSRQEADRASGRTYNAARTVDGGSPSDPATAVIWGLHAYGNSAGINITEQVAQNVSTLYACIAIRAQCLATMPISCFRRSSKDKLDKEVAHDHPVHWMWNHEPDNFLTSFNSREAASGHVDLRGNSFWELGRNFRGQAVRAYLLDPTRMQIRPPLGYDAADIAQHNPGYPLYEYTEFGKPHETFDRSEILHIANFSYDGLTGIPPLTMFRETLGLTVAANRYTSEYFRKGGRPLGFLTKPNILTKQQRDSLREEWQELHSGVENSHNVGVLSGGLDWKDIGWNNNDAQLLGLRTFQRILVAELFRTPLPLLTVDAAPESIETLQLQFIMFTMLPIMRRWEGEMNRVLFTPKEKFSYFVQHDPEIFLRADAKTMAEVDQIRVRNSLSLINEVRRKHGLNGIEGGDTPIVMASQMATLKAVLDGTANLKTTGNPKSDQPDSPQNKMVNRIAKAYSRLNETDRKKVMGMMVSMNCVGGYQTA